MRAGQGGAGSCGHPTIKHGRAARRLHAPTEPRAPRGTSKDAVPGRRGTSKDAAADRHGRRGHGRIPGRAWKGQERRGVP
ncbi:hypothetical protein ADK70_18260 [Streptomyces rimosus subsp. pseudoverticillatus]|nr:hypothetical protein ADK70_18260 [Streptomyces rimosus subsp. pseudoverticillatus]